MRALAAAEPAVDGEDAPHAEQGKGDDQEAGYRAAAHGYLDRLDQASARRGRNAHVGPDADEHADDAAGHRAGGTDEEGAAGSDASATPYVPVVGHVRRLDQRDDGEDDDRADHGERGNRRVLALDEGDRALLDRRGDVHHRLGPGVAGQDVTGEEYRKPYREQSRDRDEPLEQVWVMGASGSFSCGRGGSAAGRRASWA